MASHRNQLDGLQHRKNQQSPQHRFPSAGAGHTSYGQRQRLKPWSISATGSRGNSLAWPPRLAPEIVELWNQVSGNQVLFLTTEAIPNFYVVVLNPLRWNPDLKTIACPMRVIDRKVRRPLTIPEMRCACRNVAVLIKIRKVVRVQPLNALLVAPARRRNPAKIKAPTRVVYEHRRLAGEHIVRVGVGACYLRFRR